MIILLLLLFIFYILTPPIYSITVKNEKEFNDVILNHKSETLEININSEIIINNEKNTNITKSLKKLSIIGNSQKDSILNFPDLTKQYFFNENIKEIEIKNIYLIGNIYFNRNQKISLDVVTLEGSIKSNFDKEENNNEDNEDNEDNENNEDNKDNTINFNNFSYWPSESSYNDYECLSLSGNVNIQSSTFFGSDLCQKAIINYSGLNKYNLFINNSTFNGNYQSPSLYIDEAQNIEISNNIFYNSFSLENGGSITINKSYTSITDCTFINSLCMENGGVFYLDNVIWFNAENINVTNSTALISGGIAHVSANPGLKSKAYFKNIIHTNYDNKEAKITNGGLVMCVIKNAYVELNGYIGENLFNYYGGGSAFYLGGSASLIIKNVKINKIRGFNVDGLLLYTLLTDKAYFKATNIRMFNAYQYNPHKSAILMWATNNVKVELENITVENSGGFNAW
ncbi:hypothetical protein BCR32DRAFT_299180 [Anaeromyces robustus]|uniref:Right handed beta helix domain-containing protein n=1 Tax=Anaeromyces robustus TaxID=1754192 RepID=A0A1Y1XNF4_9FUNG|nr:hypothetical protein BCR32DRAFT_299180 [Anaeromyces robustus]|eukprot:ORX87195.1 hypothetical protein BCR32DRAFT_299180 [Anaeromyces robustus]